MQSRSWNGSRARTSSGGGRDHLEPERVRERHRRAGRRGQLGVRLRHAGTVGRPTVCEPLEPRRRLEPLEDLACFGQRPLVARQLGVLEQRDREPERDVVLAERGRCRLQAFRVTRHAPSEAERLCLHERQPEARRLRLDRASAARRRARCRRERARTRRPRRAPCLTACGVSSARIGACTGLQCLRDACLRAWRTAAAAAACIASSWRFTESARNAHPSKSISRTLELAAVQEDVEDPAEHAAQARIRPELLVRELVESLECLVPAAHHGERVASSR